MQALQICSKLKVCSKLKKALHSAGLLNSPCHHFEGSRDCPVRLLPQHATLCPSAKRTVICGFHHFLQSLTNGTLKQAALECHACASGIGMSARWICVSKLERLCSSSQQAACLIGFCDCQCLYIFNVHNGHTLTWLSRSSSFSG